jgi:hypothetical protein
VLNSSRYNENTKFIHSIVVECIFSVEENLPNDFLLNFSGQFCQPGGSQ